VSDILGFCIYFRSINKNDEVVLKVHHLPLALPARVLLLSEEEKANILLIIFFPSFVRRGVMPEGS
jgi:hypothetical protein